MNLAKQKTAEDVKQYLAKLVLENFDVFDHPKMEEIAKEFDKIIDRAFVLGQRNPPMADVKNPWGTDTFRESWIMWVAFRKEKGSPIKGPISANKQLKKLIKLSNNKEEIAIAIIEQSIDNNWTGLFPLSKENQKGLSDGIPVEPDMDWYNKQTDPHLVVSAGKKWRANGWVSETRQTGAGSRTAWKRG